MTSLLKAAVKARKATETIAKRRKYSDLRTLRGYCAIAAGELWYELRKQGIDARIASNHEHAFILVDSKIVDITASQFDYMLKRVVIRDVVEKDRPYFWRVEAVHFDVKSFREHQKTIGWPREQWALTRNT